MQTMYAKIESGTNFYDATDEPDSNVRKRLCRYVAAGPVDISMAPTEDDFEGLANEPSSHEAHVMRPQAMYLKLSTEAGDTFEFMIHESDIERVLFPAARMVMARTLLRNAAHEHTRHNIDRYSSELLAEAADIVKEGLNYEFTMLANRSAFTFPGRGGEAIQERILDMLRNAIERGLAEYTQEDDDEEGNE